MEPSIETKVAELSTEQKIAAIREIDKQISEIDKEIEAVLAVEEPIPWRFYKALETDLKARRSKLIAHAEQLMSSPK